MEPDDPSAVRRLLLVGFMGSGKSTVGRLLARRLGWTFLDIDEVVASREGRSVARIIADDGEPYFRRLEHDATMEQSEQDRVVIATGGGWPVVPGRLEALGAGAASVWLDVPVEELVTRLAGSEAVRPLLREGTSEARIRSLLERRRSFYRRATVTVDGSGAPEEVTERILDAIPGLRGPRDAHPTQERLS